MAKRGPRSKPRQKTIQKIREEDEQRRLEEERARAALAAAIMKGTNTRHAAERILAAQQEGVQFKKKRPKNP